MGYYINFVKNYRQITSPLDTLLKNNAFVWNEVMEITFIVLKEAMCTTPNLVAHDFTNTFLLECDALGRGSGAMLM
jgi:hypothetical protein